MYFNIETERLYLRSITKEDAPFMVQLLNSEGWLKYIGDRNIQNDADAENYIAKILDKKAFFYSVFEVKSKKRLAGIVSFIQRESLDFPDLGFALLPEFHNQGYAFEAVNAYLDAIKKDLNINRSLAIAQSENTKSIALLIKLGFVFRNEYLEENKQISTFELSF